MPNLHVDWTINITTLLLVGTALAAFFKGFLSVRDSLRDLIAAVGVKEPQPTGIMGELHHIKIEQQHHRDWLIAAGMDRRVSTDRRDH